VCLTDRLHACFRKAEVFDLALLDQLLHRAGDVFDRHIRINPVLIEQIDDIDPEPLERALDSLLIYALVDCSGPAQRSSRADRN
jgi:hypothetical protein